MSSEGKSPELFLEHNGVAIYHCYHDSDVKAWYWYTVEPMDCDIDYPLPGAAQFDVRDLPALGFDSEYRTHHGVIIRHAIEQGFISGQPAAEGTTVPEQVLIAIEQGLVTIVWCPSGVQVEIVDYDSLDVTHSDPE
ncbi:MAG: hypothetical protein KDJ97_20335 [Anaerolineae bacterium]|nr:hypothetical protein [Anaerolineae bacterium]